MPRPLPPRLINNHVSNEPVKRHLDNVQMPFSSHLDELRSRLIRSVLAVAIAFIFCFYFADQIFFALAEPLRRLRIPDLTLIGTGRDRGLLHKNENFILCRDDRRAAGAVVARVAIRRTGTIRT